MGATEYQAVVIEKRGRWYAAVQVGSEAVWIGRRSYPTIGAAMSVATRVVDRMKGGVHALADS